MGFFKDAMKKLTFIFLVLFLLPFISSQSLQTLGIFKNNQDVTLLQTCSNCSYNNISNVYYPNSTTIIEDVVMIKTGNSYHYVLSGNYLQNFGRYIVCGYGDPDGIKTVWCYDFFINSTGREEPSGAILTFFIISFIAILFLFVLLFVYSMGHAIKKDFDIVDLGIDFGIYFALVGLYILQQEYIGNLLIDNILNILIYVGAFTHILFSSIFFFVSMFKAQTDKIQHTVSGGMR